MLWGQTWQMRQCLQRSPITVLHLPLAAGTSSLKDRCCVQVVACGKHAYYSPRLSKLEGGSSFLDVASAETVFSCSIPLLRRFVLGKTKTPKKGDSLKIVNYGLP